jgi:hypothetical protein
MQTDEFIAISIMKMIMTIIINVEFIQSHIYLNLFEDSSIKLADIKSSRVL